MTHTKNRESERDTFLSICYAANENEDDESFARRFISMLTEARRHGMLRHIDGMLRHIVRVDLSVSCPGCVKASGADADKGDGGDGSDEGDPD